MSVPLESPPRVKQLGIYNVLLPHQSREPRILPRVGESRQQDIAVKVESPQSAPNYSHQAGAWPTQNHPPRLLPWPAVPRHINNPALQHVSRKRSPSMHEAAGNMDGPAKRPQHAWRPVNMIQQQSCTSCKQAPSILQEASDVLSRLAATTPSSGFVDLCVNAQRDRIAHNDSPTATEMHSLLELLLQVTALARVVSEKTVPRLDSSTTTSANQHSVNHVASSHVPEALPVLAPLRTVAVGQHNAHRLPSMPPMHYLPTCAAGRDTPPGSTPESNMQNGFAPSRTSTPHLAAHGVAETLLYPPSANHREIAPAVGPGLATVNPQTTACSTQQQMSISAIHGTDSALDKLQKSHDRLRALLDKQSLAHSEAPRKVSKEMENLLEEKEVMEKMLTERIRELELEIDGDRTMGNVGLKQKLRDEIAVGQQAREQWLRIMQNGFLLQSMDSETHPISAPPLVKREPDSGSESVPCTTSGGIVMAAREQSTLKAQVGQLKVRNQELVGVLRAVREEMARADEQLKQQAEARRRVVGQVHHVLEDAPGTDGHAGNGKTHELSHEL